MTKKKKNNFLMVFWGVVWGLGVRGTQESHFCDEKMAICPAESEGKIMKIPIN